MNFNIVKFYDPKHETDKYCKEDLDLEYTKGVYEDNDSEQLESVSFTSEEPKY